MMKAEIPDDITVGALVHWAERLGCKLTIKFEPTDNGAERQESSILVRTAHPSGATA